jgi:hypothetical protein
LVHETLHEGEENLALALGTRRVIIFLMDEFEAVAKMS